MAHDGDRRSPGRLLLAPLLALAAAGCAGPGEQVNEAALERWTSPHHDGEAVAPVLSDLLIDLAGAEEHRIGPDDLLAVTVRDLDRLGERSTLDVRVSRSGSIELPLAGSVLVGGLTAGEARARVVAAFERFLEAPEVGLVVREHQSARIAVLGAVAEPGLQRLPAPAISLTEALALAGGVSEGAGTRAYVLRAHPRPGEPRRVEVDLDALERGDARHNQRLRHGDVVRVPRAPPFFVTGHVARVGEYPLDRPTTVLEAVAIAGGVQVPDASPTLARIRRRAAGGEQVIPVDLVAIAEGEAPDVRLVAGDVVEVPQSTARWVVLGVVGFMSRVISFGYNLAALL